MWRGTLILILVAMAGAVRAEAIDPGAPEGAALTLARERVFETYALPVGPVGIDGSGTRQISGAAAWAAFRIDDPEAGTAAVMAGYRQRLAEQGVELIHDCAGLACGGFDFRFGVSILPPPGMLMDVQDFAQLSGRRGAPEVYVSILASRVQGTVYVQTVTLVPTEAPAAITEAPQAPSQDDGVLLPQDGRELLDRLRADGHVRVEGLAFETGGAALSGGSDETLDLLARMLTRDAELSVAIVGHSDNEGGLEPNIALSQRRAEAVMQALIARGVVPGQLEARGVGYLAPVTSNTSEEGRARNRRVELVLR